MQSLFKHLFWLNLVIVISAVTVFDGFIGLQVNAMTASRDDITLLFPAQQEFKGEGSLLGGSILTPFIHTVNVETATGEIRITTVACDFEYQSCLDRSLQVKDSIFVFKNQDMIKFLGHDKRVTKFNGVKNLLEIQYFLNGVLKSCKKIPCDQNTIDSDTLMVFLQGMLLKKSTNFNMNIIPKAKGMRVNANFNLIVTDDFQKVSPQYKFPEQFKKIAKQRAEVYVYIMELTGLPNLVYPYRYYFAYRKEPPYQSVAYWGGASKEEEFAYLLE